MSADLVHLNLRSAIRSRLLSLSSRVVSGTTISVAGNAFVDSANGFGSYSVGDEITASGFTTPANNGSFMVTGVTAGSLVVDAVLTNEAAGGVRQIAVGLPAGRAWEGRPFSPVIGRPYFSELMIPINSDVRALGLGGTIAHNVSANLTLRYPSGKGTAAIERMAGAFMELFRPGTAMSYGGTSVTILQAERRALIADVDWVSCPVIIDAVSYTAN